MYILNVFLFVDLRNKCLVWSCLVLSIHYSCKYPYASNVVTIKLPWTYMTRPLNPWHPYSITINHVCLWDLSMLNYRYVGVMHMPLSCKVNILIGNTHNISDVTTWHYVSSLDSWYLMGIWLHRNRIINITTLYEITVLANEGKYMCVYIGEGT